ncbi:hypothetical protein [Streptomyces sp. NPDC056160]|uniref:hypothetical protein n=1 Tax=Streptomyces sp. NPDC056160 TaxID=3345731 RepID=UPI0035DE5ABD
MTTPFRIDRPAPARHILSADPDPDPDPAPEHEPERRRGARPAQEAALGRPRRALVPLTPVPPPHLPLWTGPLVGNLPSSFIRSLPTMPRYVNRLLGRWLRPPPDEPARTAPRGLGAVAVAPPFRAVVLHLFTARFRTLP